jgi:hypothetical protein
MWPHVFELESDVVRACCIGCLDAMHRKVQVTASFVVSNSQKYISSGAYHRANGGPGPFSPMVRSMLF